MTENKKTSIRPNPNGDMPRIDPAAYIDPSAQVIGNVNIGPEVFVGPNAVIRADESDNNGNVQSIDIGAGCNVQDGVIIHALGGTSVKIGQGTSLAHGCIIHGQCTIGKNCFIGFRAVIYKAVLADEVFINTGAIVQGIDLGANSVVPAAAAICCKEDIEKLVTKTTQIDLEFIKRIANTNIALTKGYIELNK